MRVYRPFPSCSCGKRNFECFMKFIEILQKDHVFKFLNGLNETYQGLRSQGIAMKPFPSIDEVYNMVLREETQRSLLLQTRSFTDSAAMAVKKVKNWHCILSLWKTRSHEGVLQTHRISTGFQIY